MADKTTATDTTPTDEVAFEDEETTPEHAAVTDTSDWFTWDGARRAYQAGIAGAITGITTNVTIGGVLADGKIDSQEIISIASFAVGGFVVAFFAAWLPKTNK